MRAHSTLGALVGIALLAGPSFAEDMDAPTAVPMTVAAAVAGPQAIVAARTAQTLQAVAAMQNRLADLVPHQPRTDAISLRAADYSAQWTNTINTYAELQWEMVDSMILGLNTRTQERITEFLEADLLPFDEPVLDDTVFLMPTDFVNPPPISAGFFGS